MVVSVVIMEKLQLIAFVEILPGLNPQNIKLFIHVHYTYKKILFLFIYYKFINFIFEKDFINMFLLTHIQITYLPIFLSFIIIIVNISSYYFNTPIISIYSNLYILSILILRYWITRVLLFLIVYLSCSYNSLSFILFILFIGWFGLY